MPKRPISLEDLAAIKRVHQLQRRANVILARLLRRTLPRLTDALFSGSPVGP